LYSWAWTDAGSDLFTADIIVAAVNPEKSSVNIKSWKANDPTGQSTMQSGAVEFINETTVRLTIKNVYSQASAGDHPTIEWEVIEYIGAKVQRGVIAGDFSGAVTLAKIKPERSMCFINYGRIGSGLDDLARVRIISSTGLYISTGQSDGLLSWEVVNHA
jgi:hypothetical protein